MRISGVNIPDEKQVGVGLTSVFGIGRAISQQILADLKIDPQTKIIKLTEVEEEKIREKIQSLRIEGDLRTEIQQKIKHQINIQSYKGVRHNRKLPVRGQRTKTNARTRRGRKVTVGSGRKPSAQKT